MASLAALPARTVLVVDDDADMRFYIRGCLRTSGSINVLEAEDGLEALQLLRTVSVDLIVSDVMMPRLDGAALCQKLKADADLALIPFVVITGENTSVPKEADAFLTKPFNAALLRACIAPLFDNPP